MKMKKLVICIMAVCLSLTFIPIQAKETVKPSTSVTAPKPAEVKALDLRLNEIKSMDKSKLSASEKKNLRKEVKAIKHQYRDYDVVYVSAGTIILIIILLIILL